MLCLAHNTTNSISLNNSSTLILGDKALFGFEKRRRRRLIIKAVEKDEVERDKAREALRKLDDQLQSLSNKQLSTPKIRAEDVKQTNLRGEKEEEISGWFLTSTATLLLVFTIIYNVIFITVIKPSVDGPETLQYTNQTDNDAPPQKLSTTAQLQLAP